MSTQLPTPTDVTNTLRRGGSFDVWIGRGKCRLEDHRLTFVGDGMIAPFILGEQYKIVPSESTPDGKLAIENLDRGGKFTVYAEDMEYCLQTGGFHIHNWR